MAPLGTYSELLTGPWGPILIYCQYLGGIALPSGLMRHAIKILHQYEMFLQTFKTVMRTVTNEIISLFFGA